MIRISYENTETGQGESAELDGDDWVVLAGKASDVAEAMFHGIARRNGIMREFRAWELAGQAFDGLARDGVTLMPLTDAHREAAHMAIVSATLRLADYVTHALHALPEARRAEARALVKDLGLIEE